jgi:hypothetical protein
MNQKPLEFKAWEDLRSSLPTQRSINNPKKMNIYAVTGTFHGSIVEAKTEGDARRAFHAYYGGESILSVKQLEFY